MRQFMDAVTGKTEPTQLDESVKDWVTGATIAVGLSAASAAGDTNQSTIDSATEANRDGMSYSQEYPAMQDFGGDPNLEPEDANESEKKEGDGKVILNDEGVEESIAESYRKFVESSRFRA